MRQIAGAVGTALLVSIMTHTANPSEGMQGMINGVNTAFLAAAIISLIGLLLSLTLRKPVSHD
jgi:NADH:ubiquinone oxidoreductase subunit 6 (subunit J)